MESMINIFEKDIADHELKIIIDNGVNRIIEFRNKNGSLNQFFIVMQAKGRICFTGDMGDFIFTNHDNDMLDWFHGNMSLSHIAEKRRTDDTRKFDEDSAKESIKMIVYDFCRDYIYDYIESGCDDENDDNFENALASWQRDLYHEVIDELDFEDDEAFNRYAYDLSVKVNDSIKFEIDVCDGIDCME